MIRQLKCHFAVHGIPHQLITDNATSFSSKEFKNFAHLWDFQHVTSSPNYPRSNGLAERGVRSENISLRSVHVMALIFMQPYLTYATPPGMVCLLQLNVYCLDAPGLLSPWYHPSSHRELSLMFRQLCLHSDKKGREAMTNLPDAFRLWSLGRR